MKSRQIQRRIERLQSEIAAHRHARDNANCDSYALRSMAAIDRKHKLIRVLMTLPDYLPQLPLNAPHIRLKPARNQ